MKYNLLFALIFAVAVLTVRAQEEDQFDDAEEVEQEDDQVLVRHEGASQLQSLESVVVELVP